MATPFNAKQAIDKAAEQYGFGKGEYYKVQDGDNKFRLLSPFVGFQSEFKGTPTFKFVAWVLDRRDGKIKPYFMPVSVADMIGDLQMSEDYGFTDVPMPYDLNLRATNAGTKEVKYNLLPSPNRIPLTPAEEIEFNKAMPVDEYVEKLREKKAEESGQIIQQAQPQILTGYEKAKAIAQGLPHTPSSDEVDVSDIPFN
jgi:hypothetical protein